MIRFRPELCLTASALTVAICLNGCGSSPQSTPAAAPAATGNVQAAGPVAPMTASGAPAGQPSSAPAGQASAAPAGHGQSLAPNMAAMGPPGGRNATKGMATPPGGASGMAQAPPGMNGMATPPGGAPGMAQAPPGMHGMATPPGGAPGMAGSAPAGAGMQDYAAQMAKMQGQGGKPPGMAGATGNMQSPSSAAGKMQGSGATAPGMANAPGAMTPDGGAEMGKMRGAPPGGAAAPGMAPSGMNRGGAAAGMASAAGAGAPGNAGAQGAVGGRRGMAGGGDGGQSQRYPAGSADDTLSRFCTAMADGDTAAASEYVSPKAKGFVGKLRDGELSEDQVSDAKDAISPISELQPDPNSTNVKRIIRNQRNQVLSFTLKKEDDTFKIIEFTIRKSKGQF